MGGLFRTVFGGSKSTEKSTATSEQSSNSLSTQQSGNTAFQYLLDALSPTVSAGSKANATLAALLGQGGDTAAADGAFKNYLGSSGYNFQLDQGSRAITGSNAARGLLNSGSTLKALTNYGQQLGSQFFGNYLNALTGLGQQGAQAANTIGGAGNYSTGTSTSSSKGTSNSESYGKATSQNGAFQALFPGGLSDRSLKKNMRKLGVNEQGIDVFEFEFKGAPGVKHVGVMADDVAIMLPEAYGQGHDAIYDTVNYSMIAPLAGHEFTAPVTEVPHG